MDIDAGTQTRMIHFGNWTPAADKPTWQGDSVASWESRERDQRNPKVKYLRVSTTHMLPGLLRKNGVPYSENAVLTEYYDTIHEPTGEQLLIGTTWSLSCRESESSWKIRPCVPPWASAHGKE